MLIVTGTKRSGTSLWMQLLIEAGHSYAGNKFPRNWAEKLHIANPRGFYESSLRDGIYHETNPHPKSGRYLKPQDTRQLLVKVFVPGLVRTDVAFMDRVIASVRPWREVVRSLRAMRAAEAEVFEWAHSAKPPVFLPPEMEWLRENFLWVRDARIRGYPLCVVPHSELTRRPTVALDRVLRFIDGPVDRAEEIAAQIEPSLHRHHGAGEGSSLFDDELVELVDTWMRHVEQGKWDDDEGLSALNDAWTIAVERGWLKRTLPWDHPLVLGTP